MTGSLRVLHVIASLSHFRGGTTSSVLQMIAGLEALGVTCEVAVSDDDGPGKRLEPEAPERRAPGRHYFVKRADVYGFTPGMGPWLGAHVRDYDLVHIHGLFSHVNGLAGRICRRHGVPYIVTPHGMANNYGMRHKPLQKRASYAFVERPLLEGAAAIHMTSRGEERDFAVLRLMAPVERIPLAVAPVPLGDAASFRTRHPAIGDRRAIVCMGRLDPIKNLEAVIDALTLPFGADVHLFVCGEGPDEYTVALRSRARERGVADRVTWLGFVTGSEKSDVLAACAVYVQPSLSESFSMAAVEAVSAGLPCVLGNNVAVSEELMKAGFAVVVPPTGEGVACGLRAAVVLKSADIRFDERARRFVEKEFSPAEISGALISMYRRVCGASVQRSAA